MAQNRAAWITAKQAHPFEVKDAPMPEPKDREIVIRNHAVAINPVDWAIQATGMLVENYPAILGCDAAGEVTAVGSKVTQFKVGDRVAGCVSDEDNEFGGGSFQLYCKMPETLAGKIPDNVSYAEASVLGLGMCTACVGLFEKSTIELPLPQVEPKPNGKTLLVWGGASSVGACGVQAAKAAGFEVATTASAHNAEFCKGLGADHVFDYKSDTVVDDIVAALKGKELGGVFAAVMGEDVMEKCAEVIVQLGGPKVISSVLPPQMPFAKPLPGDVKVALNWGSELKNTHVGPAIWHDWVPAALANGTLKCKPDANIVGQGLEKIQEAVDVWRKGTSAQKHVVELP